MVAITCNHGNTFTGSYAKVNGVYAIDDQGYNNWYNSSQYSFIVPASQTYSAFCNLGIRYWGELR